MALVIHLKKGARVIVNGAVLENVGHRTVSIGVRNEAAVMRGEDVLSPGDAVTPAGRVYYALQCVYLFPERRAEHLRCFHDCLDGYVEAAPSARPIAAEILSAVEADNFYAALKKAQSLIRHEAEVLTHAHERLVEELQHDAVAG